MRLRPFGRLLTILLVAVIASVIGAAATVVGAATTTSVPAAFAIGLVAVIGSSLTFAAVAQFLMGRRACKRAMGATGAVAITGWRSFSVLAFAVALLLSASWAVPRPARPSNVLADSTTITLSDGNQVIASLTRPDGPVPAPPVIFVHGGPGISDMDNDVSALRPLARDRALIVYDQIGAGASSRLLNPAGYTLTRSVADRDAVRDYLGGSF